LWTTAQPNNILFCRGTENDKWGGGKQNLLVPGQKIRMRTAGREARALTTGTVDTADYAPLLSLGGKDLFFLRLNRYDRGSLYYLSTDGGREVELIRGLNGSPGYYGNYYPEWLKIHWKK